MERVPEYAGTINTMLLISLPLTDSALARAVVTMTEGKSAALQRLAVPSRQSSDLATGTGTDQYCVAAPVDGPVVLTSTSSHVKLGELIGRVARDATMEALRWQNGLEASYTRGVVHALGRYGFTEASLIEGARAVVVDLAIGDPVYQWHPVRLIGGSLRMVEQALRRAGADGYGGGIALFAILAAAWVGGVSLALPVLAERSRQAGVALHLLLL